MILRAIVSFLLTIFAANLAAQPPEVRGVVLPLYAQAPDLEYAPFLEEISDLGATHVSLLFPLFQQNINSATIHAHPERTIPTPKLRKTIQAARSANLEVMLFPIVLLEDDRDGEDWRGGIEPADPDQWYQSYTEILQQYATIAEEENVSILSIGSELSSLEGDAEHWRTIAQTIRTIYSGELLYTSNWDTPDRVLWWDAVDYMGVSGYYELADHGDATTQSLTSEWLAWKEWLLAHRDANAPNHKIIFCEIGYPSIDSGAAFPWDYTMETPLDYEEQRRGFEAFIRAWDGDAALHGAFVYCWFSFDRDWRRGYSIRHKPAAELIGNWYQSQ